jgi:nuclease-like protein
MLIDLFTSDLVAGYKEVETGRQALLEKWRFELLRAYTAKWDHHLQELARQERRKKRYQQFLPFIGVILLFFCSMGAWLTLESTDLACLGMILTLSTGFGVLIALGVWMSFSQTPLPPENPVSRTSNDEDESPLRQRLFPELLPLWQRKLAVGIPTELEVDRLAEETGKWGLIGEFDLIRALEQVASYDTYILHRVQLKPGDDLDVVVIGPKGIWYFEVKHWNADFIWQNGTWQILQFDRSTQNFEPVPLNEYPDQQWVRMREEAVSMLNAAGSLLKKLPVLANIQGGIVFSNVHARIEIDRLAPFRYGTIEQWAAAYQSAPRLRDMSPERALQLVEILLKRHQSLYPGVELHSTRDIIAKVVADVEVGIQEWVDSP